MDHYRQHYQEVRPIINKNSKAKKHKPFYEFFDGRKQIDLAALKKAAETE
jgi:hypothetical protein